MDPQLHTHSLTEEISTQESNDNKYHHKGINKCVMRAQRREQNTLPEGTGIVFFLG